MFHVGFLGYKASKGGFPLSRNFHVRTHVNFTRVKKIEVMYDKTHVNVKVERGSTFAFTRDLPYIAFISFTRKIYVRKHVKITQQWKSTSRLPLLSKLRKI